MSRPAARIRHDEITRMVKAVQACGLQVARVTFDGNRVDVIIGESVKNGQEGLDHEVRSDAPIREPQL